MDKGRRPVGLPDPSTVERSWTVSYPAGVPASYEYPRVPLPRLLDDAAQDFPDVQAVEFFGHTLTYRRLLDQVDRLAGALRDLGVGKGDRVGLLMPNCPQHVVAIFAVLRLGAIVAEHDHLATEAELEQEINDAGCKVLLCLDPIYPKLAALDGRLHTVQHIIGTGVQDYLPFPKNVLFPLTGRRKGTYYQIANSQGVLRLPDLIRRTAPTVAQRTIDVEEDVAMLLYSQGATGTGRAVMLTHHNLVANAFQGRLWMPDTQAGQEGMLCVLPFSRPHGITMCLTTGVLSAATLVLLPNSDTGMVLRAIAKRRPTMFPGVPAVYEAITKAPNVRRYDLSSLRICLSVSAPLPMDVARTLEALTGGKVREGYGLPETSPLTHANPIYGRAKQGRIGLPIPDTVCTLVDLEDPTKPATPGTPGGLAVSGPQVMKGYWNRPAETEAVLRDGWLLTGAVAEIDDEGYFAIVGRQ